LPVNKSTKDRLTEPDMEEEDDFTDWHRVIKIETVLYTIGLNLKLYFNL
jgi:hypothetical protein